MILNYKYRLRISDKDKRRLDSFIFEYNQAYNISLNLIQTDGRKMYDDGIKSNVIFNTLYKKVRSSLKSRNIQDKSALTQDALREAYNTLFTNIKKVKRKGNTNFKLHFKDSSRFDGSFKYRTNEFNPKIFGKKLNHVMSREIPHGYRILGSRIKREGTEYYIIYTITDDKDDKIVNDLDYVGIDANQGNYTFSNGYRIDFLQSVYPDLEKKRIFRQRKLSSKTKGSKKRKKSKLLLYRTSRKIKRRRTDDIQKRVTKVLNDVKANYVIEKLDIKKMTKKDSKGCKGLTKNMLHVSHNQFFTILSYKATLNDRIVVSVNPAYTSRTCSRCGYVKEKLSLSDRVYKCHHCGLTIDRDLNAAINIKGRVTTLYG